MALRHYVTTVNMKFSRLVGTSDSSDSSIACEDPAGGGSFRPIAFSHSS